MRVPPSPDDPRSWEAPRCECRTRDQHDAGCETPRTALDVVLAAGEWIDRGRTFHVGGLT